MTQQELAELMDLAGVNEQSVPQQNKNWATKQTETKPIHLEQYISHYCSPGPELPFGIDTKSIEELELKIATFLIKP